MRTYGSIFDVRWNVLRSALTCCIGRALVLPHVEPDVVDVEQRRKDLDVQYNDLTTAVDSLAIVGYPLRFEECV